MMLQTGHCQQHQMMQAPAVIGLGRLVMHILGIVVAIIAGAAIWYWRFQMLREAGSEVADAVGRVRGRYRMKKFKKQAEGSVLAGIHDPALAAAVFLFALGNENPATQHRSEAEVRKQIATIVPAAELDETLSYAQWAARDIADARDVVRRFKPLWREKLSREERMDLVAMAEAITGLSDEPDHAQQLSFTTLRAALGPDQNR